MKPSRSAMPFFRTQATGAQMCATSDEIADDGFVIG
jgi:hypothetical protein